MPGDRWCDVLGFAPADVSSSSTFTSFEDLPKGRQRFISLGAGQPDFKFVTFPISEIKKKIPEFLKVCEKVINHASLAEN